MNKNKGEESHFGLIAAEVGLVAAMPLERLLCVCVRAGSTLIMCVCLNIHTVFEFVSQQINRPAKDERYF